MKKIGLLLFCLLSPSIFLHAETALSLNEALEIARRDNPEIKAARKKWEAARLRISQAATPDKPRLDIERMYGPRDKDVITGAEEKNLAVTQEFPFPTALYYSGKKSAEEARVAEALYHAKERDVTARVKIAFAMLAQTIHHARLVEENTSLMKRFARIVESKYAVGKASQSEALKAQVELARMLNMLVDLQQERDLALAMLNTLLNRDPMTPVGEPMAHAPQTFNTPIETLQARARAERPELRQALHETKAKRAGLWAARSEFLPDIMLQYRRRDRRDGMESHDAVLGLTLPIWFWKQSASAKEARADLDLAESEEESMANMTAYEVQSLATRTQTALRMIQLYETSVMPQAKQAVKVAEAAYQADRGGFLELLDASRSLLDFEQDYFHSLTDGLVAMAELERIVGPLEETK